MPYDVLVLRSGYCREMKSGEYDVACTVTLLKGRHNILVNTGSAWESDIIKTELRRHGLNPDQIDYVIGTHGHSDHIGNLNLFTQATHIVCHDVNKGNIYQQHAFDEDVPYAIDEDVTVESTPGHTSQDVSVFVLSNSTELGLVAVCGDIFECEDDLDDPSRWQTQSQFPELQLKSRQKIIDRVDTIIPGHGKLFKAPKSLSVNTTREQSLMITSVSASDLSLSAAASYAQ